MDVVQEIYGQAEAMKEVTRERAAQLFGALSHPTRLRLVELLADSEKTVNDLAHEIQIGQSGVSQHLSILARAGVLVVEQRGVYRFYRVRGPRIPRILHLIEEFCELHSLYGSVNESEEDPEE